MRIKVQGKITDGGTQVQLDVTAVGHPDLPTYGITVPYPTTRANLITELQALRDRAVQESADNATIAAALASWGLDDFDSSIL